MNKTSIERRVMRCVAGTAALLCTATASAASGVVPDEYRWVTLSVFAGIIALTLVVTFIAARRGQSAADFYTAGGGISGLKNGFAIAGDYLSAAAFLGVSGLVAVYGYDGILYLTGFFVAFIPVLLLVAEPCRNLGRYTLGDILAYRNDFRAAKLAAACSGVIVSICYLIPQIVGGAVLVRALIGIDYEVSVLFTGGLMLIYVVFGGMRATTWVQIIKAILLVGTCFIIVVLSWAPFGFSVNRLFDTLSASVEFQAHVAGLLGRTDGGYVADPQHFFEPGLYLKNPLEQISLGIALVLGTAAMPHIMMRFFTVPDAKTARSSVLWAMLVIGICHLLIIAIGFAAAHYVGASRITTFDKGGNLAAPLLAQLLGGGAHSFLGNLMLAFVSAVAFATIVAVVAGLTLAAASSLAHDVYVGAIRNEVASSREQVVAAKLAAVLVGALSIAIGLLAKGQNVAQLVGLAFAVAASANLPALLLTLYWRPCNTTGVVWGVVGGTVCSIGLVLVSPNMQYPALQAADAQKTLAAAQANDLKVASSATRTAVQLLQERMRQIEAGPKTSIVGLQRPLIELRNPGIISIPLGFLLVILGSLFGRPAPAPELWDLMRVRRSTGIGRATAIAHE